MSGRNLRLLGREESPARQPDIHEIIRDLEGEIAWGRERYTPEEVALLERKLAEYQELLRSLTHA